MQSFTDHLLAAAKRLWSVPLPALLLGTGLYCAVRIRFLPFRRVRMLCRNALFSKAKRDESASSFRALCTSLAGTIGTGTVAGVAGAIALGGPGAVFWMWVSALFGMATKYTEIVISHRYRRRDDSGGFWGGPMLAMQTGIPHCGRILALAFSACAVTASLGIGNLVQAKAVMNGIEETFRAFGADEPQTVQTVSLLIGVLLCLLLLFTGTGKQSAARFAEAVVPAMCVLYLGIAFVVLFRYRAFAASAVGDIVKAAFRSRAVLGAGVPLRFSDAVRYGVSRGILSNEAGLGSSPIAHASAKNESSVEQGLFGMLEVFFVTMILCTVTALVILLPAYGKASAYAIPYGAEQDAALTLRAIGTVFHPRIASVLLTVSLAFFAVSSLFTWREYGTRCAAFLFPKYGKTVYGVVFALLPIAAVRMQTNAVFAFSDLFNALMTAINIVGILCLARAAEASTREYFTKHDRIAG